jgi:uncharacterized lipoprotein YmbA
MERAKYSDIGMGLFAMSLRLRWRTLLLIAAFGMVLTSFLTGCASPNCDLFQLPGLPSI